MAATLNDIRQRFQTLYDVQGSAILDPNEQAQIIGDGYRALWSEVVAVNKSFRVTVETFTLTTLQYHDLPADFMEVYLVRKDPGTDSQLILPMWPPRIAQRSHERSYRLQGQRLYIEPRQLAPGNYDLLYVPQCPAFGDPDSELDVELDQFQQYIVWYAVIQALAREESPTEQFAAMLAGERERVRRWASDQRSAEPDVPDDVKTGNWWAWGYPV